MGHPKLSVNINKYALLRNSRGRDVPNLERAADTCLAAGAHGITVHPRADQRHIRFDDVPTLAAHMAEHHPGIELNIECEASDRLIDLVCQVRPAQCTLVPVTPGEVTSDHGYVFPQDADALAPIVQRLRAEGIRVSAFMDCTDDPAELEGFAALAALGVHRAELYTGPYAWAWNTPDQQRETDRIDWEPRPYRLVPRGRETVDVPAGAIDCWRIDLLRGRSTEVASYWFAADGSAPLLHALVRYEDATGVSFELVSLDRYPYWERGPR